jgi:hypothetical protein
MDGKTARGASSPANPALHMPEPLSTTRAATSSSHMVLEVSMGRVGERIRPTFHAVCLERQCVPVRAGAGMTTSRMYRESGCACLDMLVILPDRTA